MQGFRGRLATRSSLSADDAVDLAKRHLVQPWPFAGSIGTEARSLIGSGDGIYITDGDGKRLIDGPAGMWCVNVGHRREELAARDVRPGDGAVLQHAVVHDERAVGASWPSASPAMRRAISTMSSSPPAARRRWRRALRFMQFYNNVRGRPEKKLILSRGGAYHGSTYLSASLNGRPRDRDWMDGADDLVVKLSSPDPFRRPDGMTRRGLCRFPGRGVPATRWRGSARTGSAPSSASRSRPRAASSCRRDGYLKRIREICRDNDILYISDEVVTAFGRLGHVFASGEVFGIDPDMITFAKGVTSGYFPLGGVDHLGPAARASCAAPTTPTRCSAMG